MTTGAPRSVSLLAPAKLNLGLRIVGVREDGYHRLESLFVPLDLADELTVSARPGNPAGLVFALLGEATEAPGDAQNLAARAASAYLEASGLELQVRVELRKRVPVGAGLGGGSSDAAAVLRALDQLCPGAVPAQQLRDTALGLGADVPFFLDPCPSLVRGIGERVEPAAGIPSLPVLIVNPGVSLATAAVYAEFDRLAGTLTPAPSRPTLRPLAGRGSDQRSSLDLEKWLTTERLQNDLEAPAARLLPEIRQLGERLRAAGAFAIGMSGSGATMFGVFRDQESATAGFRRAAFEAPIWARVAATAGSR